MPQKRIVSCRISANLGRHSFNLARRLACRDAGFDCGVEHRMEAVTGARCHAATVRHLVHQRRPQLALAGAGFGAAVGVEYPVRAIGAAGPDDDAGDQRRRAVQI